MSQEILVVVDLVNGFIHEGPLSDSSILKIIPKSLEIIQAHLNQGQDVLSLQDTHGSDSLEFEFYPPHCLKGTSECELIPELRSVEDRLVKIEKDTTNGFFAPGFQSYLSSHPDLSKVTVVGCCTDICVLQFAQSLKTYTQTIGKAMEVVVIEDAVDTFDAPGHDKNGFHSQALMMMRNAGIRIQ